MITKATDGLINYWPIVNDLKDYIGSSDMIPGTLDAGESIGFTQDRFNNPNGAIFMNPGYYILPPGIYFNNTFSFLVWSKILVFVPYSRIIDCGNGSNLDNFVVSFLYSSNFTLYTSIYRGSAVSQVVTITNKLPVNTWFHLAVIYDGQYLMLYVNGNLAANFTSGALLGVVRNKCYIGRSNWNNPDAYACYDDLMIYNRALSSNEVHNCMNASFN